MSFFLNIFQIPELRKKIVFTLLGLIVFRLGTNIPISGVDLIKMKQMFGQGGLLDFFNLFSGGGLQRFSIFALGILPFINASIIMQLLTVASPKLKELAEEGESGRKQISQYTRYLTIVIALIQSIVMVVGFKFVLQTGVSFPFFFVYAVVSLVAGAAFVMWLGELITEWGIGNGASILIFIGIISQMPFYIKNTYVIVQGGGSIIGVIVLTLVLLAMIVSIVYVQEAERKIPVQFAKRVVGRKMYGGQNTFIPLRLIQGGVMPIIFASALMQFPLMFTNFIQVDAIKHFFDVYYRYDGYLYNGIFCILIFFFAYFYTAITFNPVELADNIKKNGGFILGVRPGRSTVEFLEKIISKLTLVGACFLSFISLVPVATANMTNVTSFMGLGGTALLIIVGVAMDLVKQIEAVVISQQYDNFL